MNMEKINNPAESQDKKMEQTEAAVDLIKSLPTQEEIVNRLVQDKEKQKTETAVAREEINAMKSEVIPGKIESLPKTPAEKRLFENVGYDSETLAADKEAFSKLSNAEMYNKFQLLTLDKTWDFLAKAKEGLKPADKRDLSGVFAGLNVIGKAYALGSKSDNALRGYAELMTEHANKKPDGYMQFDGLRKVYKQAGYESSMFNGDKVFDSFQKDLAESVLTEEQRKAFAEMEKQANKAGGNSATAFAASGMSQKIKVAPIFSRRNVHELAGEKVEKAA